MRKSRFSEEQIIAILKEQEAGRSTAEVCRRHGISQPTFYSWKSKFGGLEVSEAKRLKALEEENRKLKKLLAEEVMDNATLKEMLRKNFCAARKSAVSWAIEKKDYSQRRACGLVGVAPKVWRHRTRRSDDGVLRTRLLALAAERRRFGYRRLHLLLKREGLRVNHKKLFRIYREEKLVVRRRSGRTRALGTRAPMMMPQGPNQRWSLDFVSDALVDGRRFRVLAIVDDFTRECLALVADTSLSGACVARERDAVIAARGKPHLIVSDNGTELTSTAILSGSTPQVLAGTTSSPASLSRTHSSRASTAGCATNC
jgi:putative transposase